LPRTGQAPTRAHELASTQGPQTVAPWIAGLRSPTKPTDHRQVGSSQIRY
jgi:hypothetical protein